MRASKKKYISGDKLLLRRNSVFTGKLNLKAFGTKEQPVIVDAYDPGNNSKARPVIQAGGYLAGIQIRVGEHIEIRNIEIIADGGKAHEPQAKKERYGVLIRPDTDKIINTIGKTSLGARMNERSYYSGVMKFLKVSHAALDAEDFIFIHDGSASPERNE